MTDEYQIGGELLNQIYSNITLLEQLSGPDNSASFMPPPQFISEVPSAAIHTAGSSTPSVGTAINTISTTQSLMHNFVGLLESNNGTLSRYVTGIDPTTGLTGRQGIFCIGGEFAEGATHVATFGTPNGLLPCYATDLIANQSPVPPTPNFTALISSITDPITHQSCPASYNPYALTVYQGPISPINSSWIHSIPSAADILHYGSSCWQSFSNTISEQCSKLPSLPSTSELMDKLPDMPAFSNLTNKLPTLPIPSLPSSSDVINTAANYTNPIKDIVIENKDILIAGGVIAGATVAATAAVVGGIFYLSKLQEEARTEHARQRIERTAKKQERRDAIKYAKNNPDSPEGKAYLRKQELLGVIHEFAKRHPRHEISQAYARRYPNTKARIEKNDTQAHAQLQRTELLEGIGEFATANPSSAISKAYYSSFPRTSSRLRSRP